MKKLYCFLFVFISLTFWNCKTTRHLEINKLRVDLTNDTIYLPYIYNQKLIDTLYFKIENNSKYEYFFAIPDTSVYLTNNQIPTNVKSDDYYQYFYADPGIGIILKLLDTKFNTIQSTFSSGFTEDTSPYKKSEIHIIPPNSNYNFKIIVKHPIINLYGGCSYRIPNIHLTKNVDILLDFNKLLSDLYLDEFGISLKKNQRLAFQHFIFRRPVKIVKN